MMNLPPSLAPFDLSSLQGLQRHLEKETQQRDTKARLDADLEFFATEHLRIRTKSGAIEPLAFNRAQRFVHDRLEAQRAATGRVRALILKGRQQGCSTYVGARFYHRCSRRGGPARGSTAARSAGSRSW